MGSKNFRMFDKMSFLYDGKFILKYDVLIEYSKQHHGLYVRSGNDGFFTHSCHYIDKISNLNYE